MPHVSVEVDKARKALPACANPGLLKHESVLPKSETAWRHSVGDGVFCLIINPLDCPICEIKGGEKCELTDGLRTWGLVQVAY